ncbi:MAG: LysR family transcriptional regulator [Myxococcaceae bacterium]
MAPIDLNHLRAFVAVFELQSFSRAAVRLGVPRSTVSRALNALERGMGVELFRRTTRNVAVTDEGKALYDRVHGSLEGLEAALVEGPERAEEPAGTLRVTATNDLGLSVLAEVTARFLARWPGVDCEVHLTPRVVDLVRDRYDLALRISGRPLRGVSTLVARKLGTLHADYFASPTYLARKGTPKTEADLAHHEHISFRGSGSAQRMNGHPARAECDDTLFARELCRRDGGIAVLPRIITDDDVARGSLVRVLPEHTTFSGTVWLVQPRMKNVPARVRAYRDLLLEIVRQRPLE